MKTPTSHDIAEQAYSLWESRGRPGDHESSVDCWLTAERELNEDAERENDPRGSAEDAPALDLESGPDVTNLDRALSPAERSRVRKERHGQNEQASAGAGGAEAKGSEVVEHFIVTADRAKLRIYQDNAADGEQALRIASSFDLPEGKDGYTDRDTDQAGRFAKQRVRGTIVGGSIDERLPMLEEQQRRAASELGARVNAFFQERPQATWDFAAGPVIHRALLDVLDPDVRQRLGEALTKELANQPLPELRSHFTHAGTDGR